MPLPARTELYDHIGIRTRLRYHRRHRASPRGRPSPEPRSRASQTAPPRVWSPDRPGSLLLLPVRASALCCRQSGRWSQFFLIAHVQRVRVPRPLRVDRAIVLSASRTHAEET
jgi:hypothetical protein